jgi:hypothetical protein
MRAVVYHGPGQKAWDEVPDPEIIAECPQLLPNSNRKKMFIRESVAGCRRRITVAYRYQTYSLWSGQCR